MRNLNNSVFGHDGQGNREAVVQWQRAAIAARPPNPASANSLSLSSDESRLARARRLAAPPLDAAQDAKSGSGSSYRARPRRRCPGPQEKNPPRESHCRLRKCALARGNERRNDFSAAHADLFGRSGFQAKCLPEYGMRQFPAKDIVTTCIWRRDQNAASAHPFGQRLRGGFAKTSRGLDRDDVKRPKFSLSKVFVAQRGRRNAGGEQCTQILRNQCAMKSIAGRERKHDARPHPRSIRIELRVRVVPCEQFGHGLARHEDPFGRRRSRPQSTASPDVRWSR